MLPQKQPEDFFKPRIIIPQTKFHPEQLEEMEEDMAPHQKLHMTEYSSVNAGLISDKYHNYYCSICAVLLLITEIPLQTYPLRRTEQAICLDLRKKFYKHWMKKGGQRFVKRQNGVEEQYTWLCQCGAIIGYQCCSYEDTEQLVALKDIDEDEPEWKAFKPKNKLVLYIYQDAIVVDMVFCKLITKFDEIYHN